MASEKEMLSALIRIGQLTKIEQEAFGSMWDQVDRPRGKLSNKQRAWVEKAFYAQKLDQPHLVRPPKDRSPKVGYAYDPTAKRTVSASSLEQFEVICPHIKKGGPAYLRVEKFFRSGGERFELRAGTPPIK